MPFCTHSATLEKIKQNCWASQTILHTKGDPSAILHPKGGPSFILHPFRPIGKQEHIKQNCWANQKILHPKGGPSAISTEKAFTSVCLVVFDPLTEMLRPSWLAFATVGERSVLAAWQPLVTRSLLAAINVKTHRD